jgi:tripartite-type tricarboxylate transporter receptor subunit TctC
MSTSEIPHWLFAAIAGTLMSFGAPAAAQQVYPTKPITMLVPFAAGGSTDITARALAGAAEKSLGQPIVVVNRPGATGAVALGELAKAAPDGYTIAAVNEIALAIAPHMQKVSFNSLFDFTPLLNYGVYTTFIAVRADSSWKTLKDLMDYARANPKIVTIGVPGIGSSAHLGMARLALENKAEVTFVPFPGGAPTTTALVGGHVSVASASGELLPHAKSGALRLLAMFEDTKLKDFPDVPTLRDLGYGWALNSWVGVAGPKGMDKAIASKLFAALEDATTSAEFKKSIDGFQMITIKENPDRFAQTLRRSYEEMEKLMRELGIGLYAKK